MVNAENITTEQVIINDMSLRANTLREIVVEADQHLVYDIDQHLDGTNDMPDTTCIVRTITYRFLCKRNSTLKLHILMTGEISVINRFEIILEESGAHATILGCCALNGIARQTVELVQEHRAQSTTSYSLFHSALAGHATFVYNGIITIGKNATGTDAALYNKNLLLSQAAQAIAVPSLEVHTNNVQCKHGTATGTYDQEQLLYMQSRGIDARTAQELLVRGFFSHKFNLKQEQLVRVMQKLLKQT